MKMLMAVLIALALVTGFLIASGNVEAQAISTEKSAAIEIVVNLVPADKGGDGLSGIVMDVSILGGGPQNLVCLPNPEIAVTRCLFLQTTRLGAAAIPLGIGDPGKRLSLGWVIVKGNTGDVVVVYTNVYQADSQSGKVVNFLKTETTVTIP